MYARASSSEIGTLLHAVHRAHDVLGHPDGPPTPGRGSAGPALVDALVLDLRRYLEDYVPLSKG